jgi:small subunit ribosomal protein S8e
MTKLSSKVCVRRVRVRGGNSKFRALRLETGNFSWASEGVTRKTRLVDGKAAGPCSPWFSE